MRNCLNNRGGFDRAMMAVAASFLAVSASAAMAQGDQQRSSAAELAIEAAIPRPEPANVPPPTIKDFKLDTTAAVPDPAKADATKADATKPAAAAVKPATEAAEPNKLAKPNSTDAATTPPTEPKKDNLAKEDAVKTDTATAPAASPAAPAAASVAPAPAPASDAASTPPPAAATAPTATESAKDIAKEPTQAPAKAASNVASTEQPVADQLKDLLATKSVPCLALGVAFGTFGFGGGLAGVRFAESGSGARGHLAGNLCSPGAKGKA